jgi:SAM-dependent methyltransferase
LKSLDDAHGRLILDYFESGEGLEVVERDDGFIDASGYGPAAYFAPYRRWPKAERAAMRLVRGRMLDVGCGAGRVALELQEHGHDVVGIDISPLALGVARRRGGRNQLGADARDEGEHVSIGVLERAR